MRSLLFVPADSERKLLKASASGADALILDLEDSVAPANLPQARVLAREYLESHRDRTRQKLWVRINPVQSALALADLAAIMPGGPDGIMLPKPDSANECVVLGHYLDALEMREGLGQGSTAILPVVTESARALFTLGTYQGVSSRLFAMTWGAEDLSAALGASTNRIPSGDYEFTYRMARSLCLLGAASVGALAIDTLWSNFKDPEGLVRDANEARIAGFSGKIAIHPDQVAVINESFTHSLTEIERARRIIEAFEAQPGIGTLQLNGQMLDRPHLAQARRILAQQTSIA